MNVVKVLADVARALVRIHAQGHIHRDVKARNVLISAARGRERRFFFQLRPIRCRESQSLTLFFFFSLSLSLSLSLYVLTHRALCTHQISLFFPRDDNRTLKPRKLTDFGLVRTPPHLTTATTQPEDDAREKSVRRNIASSGAHDQHPTRVFTGCKYTGSCVFNSSIRSRKGGANRTDAGWDFVTGLGHAAVAKKIRERAADGGVKAAKCREFLGETWTANDIMWGSMQPTERVAYWTTERMDVARFKKVATKEVEEEGRDSPSGAENGGTPTITRRKRTVKEE